MKKGFIIDIEKESLENTHFRKVLYTAEHMQLVLMSLLPGEDIGKEVHKSHDQFIRVEAGEGVAYINGAETPISDGSAIVIPAGAEHNVRNTGNTALKLYTLYAPPEHKDGTVHKTKEDAERNHADDHFDGKISE